MSKIPRNPEETIEEMVARMNATLVGKPGIVVLTDEDRPMYVGNFVSAKLESNLLIRFTNELVLFFVPLEIVSVVDEPNGNSYPSKFICDSLFIGDQTLGEIFADEIEEPKAAESVT